MDSSSSSSNRQWIYDVFINFRGEDTRNTFVSHLHAGLSNAGINTYIDYQLPKGSELVMEIGGVIEVSHISIVVFSKRYTESSWCVNELKKIMTCHKTEGQVVVPVFYDIDPSVVRHQKGHFGQVLSATAKNIFFDARKGTVDYVVSSWRSVLTEAANLSGWHVPNSRSEAELIQQIVEDILAKLDSAILAITGFPVGLESRVQEVIEFITTQPSKVTPNT